MFSEKFSTIKKMLLSLGVGLLVVLITQTSYAQKPNCNIAQWLKNNKSVFNGSDARHTFPDGTSMSNPYFQGQRTSLDKDSLCNSGESVPAVRTNSQMESLFNEVRSRMIYEISRNGSGDQQKKMIDRLKLIKFAIDTNCHALGVNSSFSNTISFSQRLTRLPKLAVVAVMAHELGHSLDPCSLSCSLHQVNAGTDLVSLIRPTVSPADRNDLEINLRSIQSNPGKPIPLDPERISQMQERLESFPFQQTSSGIALAENPVTPVMNCLSRANRSFSPLGSNVTEICRNTSNTETGAQIWGAQIMSHYFQREPPQNPEQLMGVLASFQLQDPDTAKMGRISGKMQDFENIFFSEAEIANAFGCVRTEKQKCMDEFHPSARVEPSHVLPEASEQ